MKLYVLILFALLSSVSSFAQEKKKKGVERITESNGYYREGKMKKGQKTGVWTYHHKSGKLLEETTYKAGVKDGVEKKFNDYGNPSSIGTYSNGKKVGTWVRLNNNGDSIKVETYRNDTLHGEYFEESYGPTIRGYYVNGRMHGVWVKTTQIGEYLGSVIDSTTFKNGKQDGPRVVYLNNKLSARQYFQDGLQSGEEVIWYANGSLKSTGHYKLGARDSVYTEYSERKGVRIRSAYYLGGEITRYDSTWTESGKLQQVRINTGGTHYTEKRWTNGKLTRQTYYASEKMVDSSLYYSLKGHLVTREIYLDSFPSKADYPYTYMYRPFSTQYRYHTNGKLLSVVKRRSDKPEGVYQEYDSTGFLCYTGNYLRGEKTGVWTRYNSKGAVLTSLEYEDGRASGKYIAFYSNGKKKITGKAGYGYLQDSIRVWNKSGVEVKSGSVAYDTILENHFKTEFDLRQKTTEVIGEITQEGDYGDVIVAASEASVENTRDVFSFAEEMPKFPGDSLQSYLQHNIVFPALEKEQGKAGTVYVSFVVNADGSVSDVTIAKGVPGAPGFATEAIRVFSTMPNWIPGKMNGRPVAIKMTWPVRFVQ